MQELFQSKRQNFFAYPVKKLKRLLAIKNFAPHEFNGKIANGVLL